MNFGFNPQLSLRRFVLACAFAFTIIPAGATARQEAASCGCTDLLDALVAKVEANYPGYHLEVKGTPREQEYRRHLEDLRAQAATAPPGIACVRVLQAYVASFEEGHLFVGGRPPVRTAEDSARLRAAAPRAAWTEADVRRYLADTGEIDPVEGLWIDPVGLKLAVVRNAALPDAPPAPDLPATGGRFTAFVLQSSSLQWKTGDVRAQLAALPDGSYDAVLYDDVRAPTHPHVYTRDIAGGGRLQRDGLLLHMPPTTWGKLHPVRPGQENLVDPIDPRAPTARTVGDDVVVFHIPSHSPSHASRLQALVDRYRGALGRAETLIIDLRGNEGGSTFVSNVLLPFLETADKRPARYLAGGQPAVLAAADNITYFERASWAPAGLVARLRAAEPGTLVPFADPAPEGTGGNPPTAAPAEPSPTNPRNVAILTDAMTVSAAEAFVLNAMLNSKVTLFGQPTGSSIDYQTVSVVRFGCPDAGLYVGYPVIVGGDRLPDGGVRPTGIVPDVALDLDGSDPIQQVVEHYARRSRR